MDREISFSSPAVEPSGLVAKGFRCEQNLWLPLRWGKVPSSTEELALYIGRFENVAGGGSLSLQVPAGTLTLGISPALHELNHYPPGTFTATYRGDHLCPHRGGGHYVYELFALSKGQQVSPESVNVDTLTQVTLNSLAMGRFTARLGPS